MSVRSSVCLSLFLSFFLSVCLSVCLSVRLVVFLSVCVSVSFCLSLFLSVCSSIHPSVCLSVCVFLSVCLSVRPFTRLSVCVPLSLSLSLSVCLCVCLSVCLSVYLSAGRSVVWSIGWSLCDGLFLFLFSVFLTANLFLFLYSCSFGYRFIILFPVGPPNVTLNPVPQELQENAPAVLTCNASSPLQVKITWYKNGKPIGREGSQLKIDRFKHEDQGDYHCSFSTFLTSSLSKSTLLVLKGLFLFSFPDPPGVLSRRAFGTRKR